MTTLVAVWAHPDDEAFGPSGMIRSLAERGIRNVVITATRGEGGRLGAPPLTTRDQLAAVRTQELRKACEIMGVARLVHWDYPDGGVAQVDELELRKRILEILNQEHPAVVLTFGPDGIYGHPDHIAIHVAATQAVAQYMADHSSQQPPRLYYVSPHPEMFEDDPEHDQTSSNTPHSLPPTAMIDVQQYADVKIAALHAHATQHQDWEPLLERNQEWLNCVYLHRAYPPVTVDEIPETELFP